MIPNYTSIRLEVTSKCNLNCAYCHNAQHSNQRSDMTTEEIIQLIRNLKREHNIKKILLTGGEPLVKHDICDIIAEVTRLGIKADMVTNGTLLTEELLHKLEAAGLKRIRISIDEVGDTTSVRGTSSPNQIWDIARMVVERSGIELCVHTVCSPYNVKNLYQVYKKVLEIGARRWRVFDLGYQGDFTDRHDFFDLTTYYDDIISATQEILSDYLPNGRKDVLDIEINNIFRTQFLDMNPDDFATFELHQQEEYEARLESSPCEYVSLHQLSIRSNGVGTLCQYFHNPIFDFGSAGLDVKVAEENVEPHEEFTLKMADLPHCSKCKYCMNCNSGCRARAKFLTGDIKDADPVACYLHPMVHEKVMSMLPQYVQDIYSGYLLKDGLEPKYSKEDLVEILRRSGYNA